MSIRHEQLSFVDQRPLAGWATLIAGIAVLAYTFHASAVRMANAWFEREEYSHGVLIPLIAAFLIWQRWPAVARERLAGSWWGVSLVLLGIGIKVIGDVGTFYILQQYALLIVLYGFVLSLVGGQAFRRLLVPLLILLFMIPLPEFVLQKFSTHLQLISSQVGVSVIRLLGISVAVEGNVIDLGTYKLQVAEACDGLRYLFPLMTLGFIMAYFFKTALWKRVTLFLSSIPVTVLMNSLRIGVIGITVEYWGISMAEGLLHDFQGWVVFMLSAGILLAEMSLLMRIGADRRPRHEVFGLEWPARGGRRAPMLSSVPKPLIASVAVLAATAIATQLMPTRAHVVPQRESFSMFPNQLESWTGRREALEQIYLDALKLDDYIVSNYMRGSRDMVNLYIAWYDAQRAGEAAHSPRACLPAGGWQITELKQIELTGVSVAGRPVHVNRVIIQAHESRQVVYYWFQQRGRTITNEYVVKWYLFWDGLTRSRTDGAMVRLVTPWQPDEKVEDVDLRLQQFAANVVPRLERHIPN